MISNMPLKQRQTLAILILLILILMFTLLFAKPFFSSYMDYGEKIDTLTQQIETYKRVSEGIGDTRSQLEQIKLSHSGSEYYLSENRPALAAASLQQYLNSAVRNSGGQVISTSIQNRVNDDPLPGISIQVHLRLQVENLVPLLHQIESSRPLFFIENFSISANARRPTLTRTQRQQIRRAQQANQSGLVDSLSNIQFMDVRFDLVGYALQEPEL